MSRFRPHFLLACCFTVIVCLACLSGNVQAQESDADRSLIHAAQQGDLAKVKEAFEDGAEVNAKTRYGATALSFAAEKGSLEIVKLLIEKGAEPTPQDTFYNATPLTWANMNKHKDVASYLKENGAGLPTFKADPEQAKKKADTKKTAEAKSSEEEKAEEAPFLPDSTESRIADRKVSSKNWPQFRGTGARGVADGQNPPVSWNTDETANFLWNDKSNLLWKTEIDGLGHSCPVVFGEFVYITTAVSQAGNDSIVTGNYGDVGSVEDESEHSFRVICVNKRTGQMIWDKEAHKGVPKVKRHMKSTHANCTVATNGEQVVAFFAGEGLFCYTNKGELLWKNDLGMLDSGWFYDKTYQWGFGSSPVIFKDKVIVQCDVQEQSFVASYNLADGSEVWKTERDEIPGWSSPTVVDSERGPMLVTNATGFIRGYDARTGQQWWQLGKQSEIVVPTPFMAHDLIYVTSGYRPIQPIIAIKPDAEGDITPEDNATSGKHIAWYKPRGGPYMPSAIVYGDYLYLCDNAGILTVIHATSGRRVYKKRLSQGLDQLENAPGMDGRMSMVGSPVAADGHIYFPSENGFVLVLEAGPEFKMVAANPVGENILTTPAISEGVFFIRGQKNLIAISETGDE